jgi:hypothetical protein
MNRPAASTPATPFRRRTGAALLVIAVLAASFAPVSAIAQIDAPLFNWKLPFFTKEGHRLMLAVGQEARQLDRTRYEVVGLNLTSFVGDATSRIDAVILSPAATFRTDLRVAHGEKAVRFIRYSLDTPDLAEIEATGVRWTYSHADKKISLDGNVRVTFRAEMKDLLR